MFLMSDMLYLACRFYSEESIWKVNDKLIKHIGHYSKDMRSAAEVAHGAKIRESTVTAPSRERFGWGFRPMMLASTAPAPKINTGIYSGSTSSEIKTPLPRNPTVKAAPIDPIKLSTGVPSNRLTKRT